MLRFSLSNLLLAIAPLGVGFWSARELFRPHPMAVSTILVACICAALAATVGSLADGRRGLQRGLVMGIAAVVFVGVGATVCVVAVMFLLMVAGLFA